MGLKTKISILLMAILIISCNSKSKKDAVVQKIKKTEIVKKNNENESIKTKLKCSDFEVNEYYYNDKNTFKNGSIKIFSSVNDSRAELLNKLILKNSAYILNREDYSNNKEFENFIDNMKISNYFTSNSESYQKLNDQELNEIDETITTEVFCLDKIIVYKIIMDFRADRGSPYFEYLNIDLNEIKPVNFNSLIISNKLDSFNKTILNYAANHKKEIINNYKEKIAERADQLLSSYQDVFEGSNYNYNKLKLKIDSNDFSYFNPAGLTFNVSVEDENFPLASGQEEVENYISEITIPYKVIKEYLDENNSLYSSINKLQ